MKDGSTRNLTTGRLRKRDKLLTESGLGGARGAKSYDRKKAWSSINPSIISGSDEDNGSSDQQRGFHAELASSWDEKMITI
jgi:hypothetical protein